MMFRTWHLPYLTLTQQVVSQFIAHLPTRLLSLLLRFWLRSLEWIAIILGTENINHLIGIHEGLHLPFAWRQTVLSIVASHHITRNLSIERAQWLSHVKVALILTVVMILGIDLRMIRSREHVVWVYFIQILHLVLAEVLTRHALMRIVVGRANSHWSVGVAFDSLFLLRSFRRKRARVVVSLLWVLEEFRRDLLSEVLIVFLWMSPLLTMSLLFLWQDVKSSTHVLHSEWVVVLALRQLLKAHGLALLQGFRLWFSLSLWIWNIALTFREVLWLRSRILIWVIVSRAYVELLNSVLLLIICSLHQFHIWGVVTGLPKVTQRHLILRNLYLSFWLNWISGRVVKGTFNDCLRLLFFEWEFKSSQTRLIKLFLNLRFEFHKLLFHSRVQIPVLELVSGVYDVLSFLSPLVGPTN